MDGTRGFRKKPWSRGALLLAAILLSALRSPAQGHEGEIVANLAGGRVVVHVASDLIIFATIDRPLEASSIPPRVMNLDSTHVGVLFGASEWQTPSDLRPVRLDRNFEHLAAKDPNYESYSDQAEPDLETIGVAFLEKLRPLVTQLHHKIDVSADLPIFQVVVIGYAPRNYGAEVWQIDYRIQQVEVGARGDYLQTRLLRPRFTQLYPPEKKAPHTLVEVRFPEDIKGPTLLELIEGNDPRVSRIAEGDRRFTKVLEFIEKGQAGKAPGPESTELFRALIPLVAGDAPYLIGTFEYQHGFNWIVAPTEPGEKPGEDKSRPPNAPTLRKKPPA